MKPGIEPAGERTHARIAELDELLRDLRGRRFVRAVAIENDLAVLGQVVKPRIDFCRIDGQRAGNEPGVRLAGDTGSHVDHHRPLAALIQPAQLFDRDAGEPQRVVEAATLPPFEGDVQGERGCDERGPPRAVSLEHRDYSPYLVVERHASAYGDRAPQHD